MCSLAAMGLGQHIKARRLARGWTLEQLEERSGVATGTLHALEKRDSSRSKFFPAIAKAFGVTVEELAGTAAADEDAAVTPYLEGFEQLSVAKLANAGSMGAGNEQLPDDVVVGRLTLSPSWIAKSIKPLTKMDNLRFIHGFGDSMEPTFNDGDILLVDSGVPDVKVDGIYVLEANDRLYIKRVRQRMDGSFEISSDNANVKTVDVLDGSKPVAVKGRVVWVWNGKKL